MDIVGSVIAVTGGTGFLGRHLVEELRRAGAEVAALGSGDYDLRQRDDCLRMLSDIQPRGVVHLAAVVGGIGANQAAPGRFFYDNAIMGLEMIDTCRTAAVDKVVVCGSICAYPKYANVPFLEEELWNGYPEETNAPYGLAKKMLLVQAQAYREQYGMNIVYVLPVNLYGPGDNFDLESGHVIPAMIRKFIEAREAGAQSVVLWGDGSPTREFLYVTDAARAIRLALERYDRPEPVNIGSSYEISISDLATLVQSVCGYEGSLVWDSSRPNGQPRRKLNVERAKQEFGFEAEVSFEEGLTRTAAWFEKNSPGRTGLGKAHES